MAELFRTPQKGHPRPSRSRRKGKTQEEMQELKQKVAVTTKPNRPFVFDQSTAPGEETQSKIALQATRVYIAKEFLTALAPTEYWHIHFAEWVNKLEHAKPYCIIYNADLTPQEMDNICLAVYKYICFMSTLPDYTDYQLKQSDIITKRLHTPLYNINKCIQWLAQKWPGIQLYLRTGNIYVLGKVPLEALSSREVTLETKSSKGQQETEVAEQFEYTLSEEEDFEVARVEAEK